MMHPLKTKGGSGSTVASIAVRWRPGERRGENGFVQLDLLLQPGAP